MKIPFTMVKVDIHVTCLLSPLDCPGVLNTDQYYFGIKHMHGFLSHQPRPLVAYLYP